MCERSRRQQKPSPAIWSRGSVGGIVGRPDIHAQQINREVAIGAAVLAQLTRRQKASEWQPPAGQLWQEFAERYDEGQAALAA